MSNPKARREGLLIEELPTELLVYDQKTHRAHCLNASAASVFRSADGTLSVAGIARAASERLQAPFDEALTWAALEELDKNGLLETGLPVLPDGHTRRQMLTASAIGALLPLVIAITAPTPAYAQSPVPTGSSGTASSGTGSPSGTETGSEVPGSSATGGVGPP
jgi:hypothetical protein